jgi:hypothetical protein
VVRTCWAGEVDVCDMYASWKLSATFWAKSWSYTWIIEPWRSDPPCRAEINSYSGS